MHYFHTTIGRRECLVIEIEEDGGVDLNLECLFIRHQGAYILKQTNYHANAEYRRGKTSSARQFLCGFHCPSVITNKSIYPSDRESATHIKTL